MDYAHGTPQTSPAVRASASTPRIRSPVSSIATRRHAQRHNAVTAAGRLFRCMMSPRYAKGQNRPPEQIPERLPISPMSLTCPYCKSPRGEDCTTRAGTFSAIHVERIKMAALADKMGKLRDGAERRRRTERPNET
jgi:hypothetical protein